MTEPDFGKDGWETRLRERLDAGHGKRFRLEVEYSEAAGEYRWTVRATELEWTGFEPTLELAVDTACQVYRDYRDGGVDD